MIDTDWLTPNEAAEYLRVHVSTIYKWTQESRLPAFHFGCSRRYRRQDLDAMAKPVESKGQKRS